MFTRPGSSFYPIPRDTSPTPPGVCGATNILGLPWWPASQLLARARARALLWHCPCHGCAQRYRFCHGDICLPPKFIRILYLTFCFIDLYWGFWWRKHMFFFFRALAVNLNFISRCYVLVCMWGGQSSWLSLGEISERISIGNMDPINKYIW